MQVSGIYAQCGKNRLNRIGVSICPLLSVENLFLEVEGSMQSRVSTWTSSHIPGSLLCEEKYVSPNGLINSCPDTGEVHTLADWVSERTRTAQREVPPASPPTSDNEAFETAAAGFHAHCDGDGIHYRTEGEAGIVYSSSVRYRSVGERRRATIARPLSSVPSA